MARPPAQVRFPGDKNRKQRVKVRGIKQASKEIQKRLERNLEKFEDLVILPIDLNSTGLGRTLWHTLCDR